MKHVLQMMSLLMTLTMTVAPTADAQTDTCPTQTANTTPRYLVFKTSGEVKILTSTVWQTPGRRQPLTLHSQFLLSKGSTLGILDNESHQVYYIEKEGKHTVAQIISQARKQADRITKLVNSQLRNTMSDELRNKQPIAGASYRSNGDDERLQALYTRLAAAARQAPTPTGDQLDAMRILTPDKETFYFKLTNHTEQTLYVNVLVVADGKAQLAFPLGYTCNEPFILLPPGTGREIPQFLFAVPQEEKSQYYPFATPFAFDAQALQLLLRQEAKPTSDSSTSIELLWSR
ncbi:MAG: hypothetical protein NC209_08420 [Alistipes sp.]|nr:hypothetical protein [Alistipes senegalensis]MCM1251146.1 hypothetical protein [Alistipes sp.]